MQLIADQPDGQANSVCQLGGVSCTRFLGEKFVLRRGYASVYRLTNNRELGLGFNCDYATESVEKDRVKSALSARLWLLIASGITMTV